MSDRDLRNGVQSRLQGTIVAFDVFVGLGEIEVGSDRVPFHCTQIDDGTRSVEVGRSVEFSLLTGPTGRAEATAITKR